jgi:hypothetical protein
MWIGQRYTLKVVEQIKVFNIDPALNLKSLQSLSFHTALYSGMPVSIDFKSQFWSQLFFYF